MTVLSLWQDTDAWQMVFIMKRGPWNLLFQGKYHRHYAAKLFSKPSELIVETKFMYIHTHTHRYIYVYTYNPQMQFT